MVLSERCQVLQNYYLPKYHDFLQCVCFCGGGIIFHSQMSRLLFGNKSDCTAATRLGNDLMEAHIFNQHRIGRNKLYSLSDYALHYFHVSRTPKLNATRIKLSALIIESFLKKRYYEKENPPKSILERLNKSSFMYFSAPGKQQLQQMEYLKNAFEQRGFTTDGIDYQIDRAKRRYEAFCRDKKPREIYPKECDLYTISYKNIYLSGVAIKPDAHGKQRPMALVDVYYISDWSASMMGGNIMEAKRLIEDTLQNNALAVFTVHSHEKQPQWYEKAVKNNLANFPEFLTLDDVNATVSFQWYGTKNTLFSSINQKNLI